MRYKGNSNPPGRQKIIGALTQLMETKDFHSVTTAEIAGMAGVTEALIYKYFKDKKDLLHQVLKDIFERFHETVLKDCTGSTSAIEKLEIIIRVSLERYAANPVFARMLLLEVRNSEAYFSSDAYQMVKRYAGNVLDIIEDGIRTGELRPDINPKTFRKIILGAIEHACLGEIIFGRKLDVQTVTGEISDIIFNGAKT